MKASTRRYIQRLDTDEKVEEFTLRHPGITMSDVANIARGIPCTLPEYIHDRLDDAVSAEDTEEV